MYLGKYCFHAWINVITLQMIELNIVVSNKVKTIFDLLIKNYHDLQYLTNDRCIHPSLCALGCIRIYHQNLLDRL